MRNLIKFVAVILLGIFLGYWFHDPVEILIKKVNGTKYDKHVTLIIK